jgi:hypothetical protein
MHSVTTTYDADGRVIGRSETESISQMQPSPCAMKVKITQPEKIEK